MEKISAVQQESLLDLPTGATIVCTLGAALVIMARAAVGTATACGIAEAIKAR